MTAVLNQGFEDHQLTRPVSCVRGPFVRGLVG